MIIPVRHRRNSLLALLILVPVLYFIINYSSFTDKVSEIYAQGQESLDWIPKWAQSASEADAEVQEDLDFEPVNSANDTSLIQTPDNAVLKNPYSEVHNDSNATSHRPLSVSIINAPGYHFEVVLPLLHSFSHQPLVSDLTLASFRHDTRLFGAFSFLSKAVDAKHSPLTVIEPSSRTFRSSRYKPDIMVLVSCKRDLAESNDVFKATERVLAANPAAVAICMLHELTEWEDPNTKYRKWVKKWAASGQVRMMVLSEHVKIALEKAVTEWGLDEKGVEVLPVYVPVVEITDKEMGYNSRQQLVGMAVPGKYSLLRRTYEPLFRGLYDFASTYKEIKASLHLVGSGEHPGPIPPQIEEYVHFHDKLNFGPYFSTLRSVQAIAPSFAHDHYLKDKASSTIATALIAGTPLIVGRDVLESYRYLGGEEDVWLLEDGEDVVEGFARVVRLGKSAWKEKKERVRRRRDICIQDNDRWIAGFLELFSREATAITVE